MTFSGSSLFSSFDCDEGVDSSTCSALAHLGVSWLLRLHSAAQGGSRGGAFSSRAALSRAPFSAPMPLDPHLAGILYGKAEAAPASSRFCIETVAGQRRGEFRVM